MDTWPCQVCEYVADAVKDLAAHLSDWHEDWLNTRQVPPPRPAPDPFLSF